MREFSEKLLAWYYDVARELPFRVVGKVHPNPYHVWVSEIMLQQTTVATVIDYFNRWMTRFPTLQDLADADEHDVLKAWEGLGYYSRARNLHFTAKDLVDNYGGQFPSMSKELVKLKGIGPYTAAAISSIAFDESIVVVDGNVCRVMARLHMLPEVAKALEESARLKAQKVMPDHHCGDFNSALMELGATLCSPTSPSCEDCPVQEFCKAYAKNKVDQFPKPKPKLAQPQKYGKVFWMERDGKVFIRKRTEGLLKNLWELPWVEIDSKEFDQIDQKPVRHVFSHFKLGLKVIDADLESEGIWVEKSKLLDYPFSKLMLKVLGTKS